MTVILLVDELITLTPRNDDGCPYVEVLVSGLSTTAQTTLTIDRSIDGVHWRTVRGALAVTVAGSFLARDFEAPLNVPVTYRATMSGATVGQFEASTTLASTTGWLHDPMNPRGAVPVHVDVPGGVDAVRGTAAQASFDQPVDFATPIGADRPVASVGRRQRAARVPVVLDCQGSHSDALSDLLAGAGDVVLRGLPVWALLEPSATVVITDLTVSLTATNRHRWSGQATTVASSARSAAVPWVSWQDVMDAWPGASWADVMAAWSPARWLDVMRNPGG